jgi:WD40 repeat protein
LYKFAKGGKDDRDVVFAGSDRLVTADAKQIINVWDARRGKLLRQFAHGAPVQVLATSPGGRWLATLEHHTYAIDRLLDKDVVRVWDLETGTQKHTLAARPKRWFMSVYFSPDSKRLLASSAGAERYELTIWDTETGERIREMEDAYGSSLAVSPDGSRLASGNLPGKFELWDMTTGRRLSSVDSRHARATALAFTPRDDHMVTLGFWSLSTWEITTGRRKEVFDLPHTSSIHPIPALSRDGKYALSFAGDWEKKQGFLWDVVQRRHLRTLDTRCVMGTFSLDSSLLAIWETGKAPAIRLYDVATGRATGREVRSFPAQNAAWPFLSFTADGKTLLAANDRIVGYDVSSGKELFSWRMKPVADKSGMDIAVGGRQVDPESRRAWRGFVASPDGTRVAVTLIGGFNYRPVRDRLALFDAHTGRLLRRWSDSGESASNYEQLCFSHDGQLLASSDKDALHLWEVATGKEIHTFRGHRGEIAFLAFSQDDRRLASASWDSTVLIWDATDQPSKATVMTEAKLKECWNDLAGDDAGRAHRAVWNLIRVPRESLPFLQARLHPVKSVSREQMERWVQDLDADNFNVRQKATAELDKLGEVAESALRRALANKPSLELRRRVEPMLAKLDAAIPSGETLRSVRAVRVLEHIGTADARSLLRELAKGAEGATLTRAAKAALTRLDRHVP